MLPAAILQDAAGFLLAGGQSSRMGADKALVRLHNRPFIEIALQTLRSVGLEPKIAGARSPLHAYAAVLEDIHPGLGPLSGIHAALSASTARWNIVLPVDMPLMPASLLAYLLRRASLTAAPVTALTRNGHLEPFPVVLDRAILPHIEQRLAAGRLERNQRSPNPDPPTPEQVFPQENLPSAGTLKRNRSAGFALACRAAWQEIPGEFGARLDAPSVEVLRTLGLCSHPRGLAPHLWLQSANTPADLARIQHLT